MPHRIHLFGRTWKLPQSRTLRIASGFGLIGGGILGFLPVLGFWMIPLGLLVLSREFHWLRRLRRRFITRQSSKRKIRNGRQSRLENRNPV